MIGIVEKVISCAGGATKLARKVGVSPPSVIGWRNTGRIPAARVIAVEAATGIPREELRPDLFRVSADIAPAEAR